MGEVESLSDHLYITYAIATGRRHLIKNKTKQRRWNLKKLNQDIFEAVLLWHSKDFGDEEDRIDKDQLLQRLDKFMEEACDAAAPRIGSFKGRK